MALAIRRSALTLPVVVRWLVKLLAVVDLGRTTGGRFWS